MPLVDAVENVVRFVNNLPSGYGRHIVDIYDFERSLDFDIFGLTFSYELFAAECESDEICPCFPRWGVEYYLWKGDKAIDECTRIIGQFDVRKNNSIEPVIRCIVTHLTLMVFKSLNNSSINNLK
ncbi:MAG: hypothetical protein ACW98F_20190 [Candidatus Hodarchaeales archaeon]